MNLTHAVQALRDYEAVQSSTVLNDDEKAVLAAEILKQLPEQAKFTAAPEAVASVRSAILRGCKPPKKDNGNRSTEAEARTTEGVEEQTEASRKVHRTRARK